MIPRARALDDPAQGGENTREEDPYFDACSPVTDDPNARERNLEQTNAHISDDPAQGKRRCWRTRPPSDADLNSYRTVPLNDASAQAQTMGATKGKYEHRPSSERLATIQLSCYDHVCYTMDSLL